MNSYFNIFKDRNGENSFFLGENTGSGFRSHTGGYFSEDRLSRLYVLKGGPGTGKSTLMKKTAAALAERGFRITYLFCSSDPDSLDGILIHMGEKSESGEKSENGEYGEKAEKAEKNEKIEKNEIIVGITDGTAPHVTDPEYPGACGTVVNLFECFDTEMLCENKDRISLLCKRKKESFCRAYGFLGAAEKIAASRRRLLETAFLREKAGRLIMRISDGICTGKSEQRSAKKSPGGMSSGALRSGQSDMLRSGQPDMLRSGQSDRLDSGQSGRSDRSDNLVWSGLSGCKGAYAEKEKSGVLVPRQTFALSCKGAIHLSGFRYAERKIRLCDHACMLPLFAEALARELTARGEAVYAASSPIFGLGEIYVPSAGILFSPFVSENECERVINISRFADRETLAEIRGRLSFSGKCLEMTVGEALKNLAEAGKAHGELEQIYTPAVDFATVNRITEKIIEDVAFDKEKRTNR